jgi:hypothetical protein
MTTRLPRILSNGILPGPELDALRLDGEAYRVADCVVPVDEVLEATLRAAALFAQLPGRIIVERHSAAWIWGAVPRPPARHEVCTDIGARTRPAPESRLSIREVVIGGDDVATVVGLAVTTPRRTAIDLARFVPRWDREHADIVGALMAFGGFDAVDCARVMNRRRNLPNKRMALERLAGSGPVERLSA